MGRTNTVEDVFKSIDTHDNDPSVCWEWTGARGGRDGRGYFSMQGKKYLAHRIVYELFNGELEAGLVVRHKCDNPICCNPYHLEPGTRSDNELDKYRRERRGYPHKVIRRMKQLFKQQPPLTFRQIKTILDEEFDIHISVSGIANVFHGRRRKMGGQDYD